MKEGEPSRFVSPCEGHFMNNLAAFPISQHDEPLNDKNYSETRCEMPPSKNFFPSSFPFGEIVFANLNIKKKFFAASLVKLEQTRDFNEKLFRQWSSSGMKPYDFRDNIQTTFFLLVYV